MSRNNAFTLIELILAIVIIAISVTGTLLAFNIAARFSADPLILQQANSIGKSYLEEILAKPFPVTTPCPPTGQPRSTYNNVCDYHNLTDNGAVNQLGQSISGLSSYTINVTVDTSGISFGGLASGSEVVRVDVDVSHSQIPTLTFTGYRTDY